MAATKIINVSKNDTFDEVFDLFKNTEAEEVIFIFPKGSKFAKQEQYFEAISAETESSGKQVSIMTSDSAIIDFASRNGLAVLQKEGRARPRKQEASSIEETDDAMESEEVASEPVPEQEPDRGTEETSSTYQEDSVSPDFSLKDTDFKSAEEQPEIILAAKKESEQDRPIRIIKDILKNEPERTVEIRKEKEKTYELDIKSEMNATDDFKDRITNIWASKPRIKDFNLTGSAGSKTWMKRLPLVLVGGAILVLFFIIYATFGKAQIILRPQKQKIIFDFKVSASPNFNAVNADLNRIPGQRFTARASDSLEVPATGEKNVVQKASGVITIYNKGPASQRLVATTRFQSSRGFVFRIPATIAVPAASRAGGALTPGAIESSVYADKPGDEYNIQPDKFTIPGFEGSPKFNDFYAISSKPMAGGIIGPSKVITEADFTKTQESLEAKVKDEILQSLKAQVASFKILDQAGVKLETPVTSAKVGEAAPSLKITVSGSADTIAFRESEVQDLIKKYVSKNGDVDLLQKDLSVSYSDPVVSQDGDTLAFNVHVSGQTASKTDQGKIIKDIAGMNEDSVRVYFAGQKEIESTKIVLSPFWVKKIPQNANKIKIEIDTN